MAQTDEIAHVAGGFRYFKSYTQARRQTGGIVDDIIFSVTTPGGGNPYALYLYFGVQHRNVESVPGRDYWRRRTAHATNLAVVQAAGALWNDNILLRDFLLAHPEVAATYGNVKRAVWNKGARSLLEYSRAKHDFVNDLLARARRWRSGP